MKTFCPFLRLAFVDQCLPGGQSHQGNGSGFFHRETRGLERQRCLLDGDELGERADSKIIRSRVDLIA